MVFPSCEGVKLLSVMKVAGESEDVADTRMPGNRRNMLT